MKLSDSNWIRSLPRLFSTPRLEPAQQAERIVTMQLNIVFPAKAGVIGVVLYYLASTGGFENLLTPRKVVLDVLQVFFVTYLLGNLTAWAFFRLRRRFAASIFQWMAFALGLMDGLFMAGLTFLTGGFESVAFWVFPALIVLNAMCIPLATAQILLNLLLSLLYLSSGILNATLPPSVLRTPPPGAYRLTPNLRTDSMATRPAAGPNLAPSGSGLRGIRVARPGVNELPYENAPEEGGGDGVSTESRLLRLCMLCLLTFCCYGVQLLAARQRRAQEEAHEFALREGQLHSAGRLAAEIAHQLKNPLAIINNAVFSIHRAATEGRPAHPSQLQMIQEEVNRADRILTDLMGYAQLSEGRVERLNVLEELDRAIEQIVPAAAGYEVGVERRYETELPPLLLQRRHLSGIFINLLQNAREAMSGTGLISVQASRLAGDVVEVSIADTGPGMTAEQRDRIFEAFFTTKEKGTGLGLALVKHNLSLYGATVRVESELGKGARFVLTFPIRSGSGAAASV